MAEPEYKYAYAQIFETTAEATDVLESFVVKLIGNADYEDGRIFAGVVDNIVYVTVLWISETDCEVRQKPGGRPELVFLEKEPV